MSLWTSDLHNLGGTSIPLPTYKVSVETESVRSGHSEQSSRSRRSRGHNGHHNQMANYNNTSANHNNGNHSQRNNQQRQGGTPGRSSSRHSHRSNRSCQSTPMHKLDSCNEERREGDEVIEVQILPQDDNWGDNTTCITGNTSDHSVSADDLTKLGRDPPQGVAFRCQMWLGSLIAGTLSLCAFLSPIVMVVLPKLDLLTWRLQKCGPECDGLLISFAFKLLILLVGSWAVFFRRPKATMPRIFIFRALILAMVFVFVFSYWLFYGVRIIERRALENELTYHSIVLFAVSLVDALLFIHYLAVILMEIRQVQPQFAIKVLRSPDGESRNYNMGQLSIQRASVWVLERYYRDFSIYNPYLETLPTKNNRKSLSNFKFYDVDGLNNPNNGGPNNGGSRLVLSSQSGRRRDASHNERFYEEHEYERRVRKRRARLITAAEEAFTHIKRLRDEQGPAIPMDPGEAAQSIFPSMARALQKYLRITRQQPRHTMQGILDHLALCLSHDLSPKSFLEKYLVSGPVLQNDKENVSVQTWALICDTLLSRPVKEGCVFMLRQNDVSLLVTVSRLPHFNITEEIIDPKSNKFVLRLNSETSV